ncbi:MAG: type III secretion system chaperone [Chlamydiales bacterium]
MFKAFLVQLSKVLDFENLQPDKNGVCLISFTKKKIQMLIEYDESLISNKVLISSAVLYFPIDQRQQVYQYCLKTNHKIEASISIKPDEDILYLHQRIAPTIHATELKLIIDSFLETIKMIENDLTKLFKTSRKDHQVSSPSSLIQPFPYKA